MEVRGRSPFRSATVPCYGEQDRHRQGRSQSLQRGRRNQKGGKFLRQENGDTAKEVRLNSPANQPWERRPNRNVWRCEKSPGPPSGGDSRIGSKRRQSRSRSGRPIRPFPGTPFSAWPQQCRSSDPNPEEGMVRGVARGDQPGGKTVIHPVIPGGCCREGRARYSIRGRRERLGHAYLRRQPAVVAARATRPRYQRRDSRFRRSFLWFQSFRKSNVPSDFNSRRCRRR